MRRYAMWVLASLGVAFLVAGLASGSGVAPEAPEQTTPPSQTSATLPRPVGFRVVEAPPQPSEGEALPQPPDNVHQWVIDKVIEWEDGSPPTYAWRRADFVFPVDDTNEASGIEAANYRDALEKLVRETLEERPYKFWRLSASVEDPTAPPPVVIKTVSFWIRGTREDIIPAMREVAGIVFKFDPNVERVIFIFLPNERYMMNEATVTRADYDRIDWDSATIDDPPKELNIWFYN